MIRRTSYNDAMEDGTLLNHPEQPYMFISSPKLCITAMDPAKRPLVSSGNQKQQALITTKHLRIIPGKKRTMIDVTKKYSCLIPP